MCDAHVDTVIPVGIKCMRVEGANIHVTFELQVTLFTLVLWSFFLFADNIWKWLLFIYKNHLNIRLLYVDGPGLTRRGIFFQIYIQIDNELLRPFVQASTVGIEISPMVYFSNQIQPNWFQAYGMYITPYLNIALIRHAIIYTLWNNRIIITMLYNVSLICQYHFVWWPRALDDSMAPDTLSTQRPPGFETQSHRLWIAHWVQWMRGYWQNDVPWMQPYCKSLQILQLPGLLPPLIA